VCRPFQFQKRRQHFIRTHNETLSVAGEREQSKSLASKFALPRNFFAALVGG
jgi:hypothetical protein